MEDWRDPFHPKGFYHRMRTCCLELNGPSLDDLSFHTSRIAIDPFCRFILRSMGIPARAWDAISEEENLRRSGLLKDPFRKIPWKKE